MLYFQVVILAAALMLLYYCEFTDTFSPAQLGFACRDPALAKPDPGPEQDSRIQPIILYSVVGGLPVVLVSAAFGLYAAFPSRNLERRKLVGNLWSCPQISGVEVVIFLLQHNPDLYDADKLVMMADCCYVNPMVRRTFRFLGNPVHV